MHHKPDDILEINLSKATSTNDIAKKISLSRPVVIITASEQTKGRGRYNDRIWFSPKDSGLYISIVFSDIDNFDSECLPYITKMISTSVYETLADYNISLFIKPPNDIYTKTGKIAGVLAESKTKGNIVERIISSAGINIKRPDKVPIEIKHKSSYLSDHIKIRENEIDILKKGFLKNLFKNFELVKNKKYSLIDEKFSSYLI